MSSELFFENKKYISAKDASALTGYSKDYIGQLSRQNKIDSRKIGKVWYVSEESLLNYKNLPTESSLDPKKNSPEIPSEISPVSAEDSAPELPSGNSQTALETKVFSATRDADQDAGKAVSPAPEILPKKQPSKYKQFAHEVLFALDTNLAKKAVPLALGLLLAIGFGVFARDAESFRQDSELGALPAKLSAEVAALPRLAYDAVSSVVDMYAGKAYPAYLSFGDFLIKKTSLLASDPLEFVADSAKGVVAFSRNSFNRTAGVFGEALLSLNDRAFAFISDAVSVKSSDLTAAVAVASQGKLNVVDHSGVVVYETINRWFEQGIYNPIASLFGKREPTIIYVATAPQASSTPAAAKPATVATTVNPTKVVNTTNVIERVVEREVAGDFTKADVETLVAQLDSKIQAELAGLSTGSGGVVNNIYQQIAQSQRIDQLNNTTINNPTVNGGTIANANITGGTIDGATLNNVTLGSLGSTTIPNLAVTNTSTSTFSGGLAVSGGCVSVNGICLGTGGGGAGNPGGSDGEIQFNNGGSFDGGVAFVYASSTGNVGIGTTSPYAKLSVAGTVVADSFNATSTTATSTFANGVNLTGGCFAVNGVCFTGSGSSFSYPFPGGATSTPLSFAYSSTTYASFTTASTTNFTAGFFTLSTTTAGTLKTTSTGLVYIDTSSGTAASSTLLSDTNTFTGRQIFANSSTTLGSFNYASATTANIGTLNLFAGLNGPLQANGGVVSATTSIGVLYGGTGLAAAPAYGQVLVGNSSGGYTLTATSSLGLGASFTTTYPLQLSGNNLSLLFGTTTANNWGAVQTFAYSSTTYASFTAASTTNLSIGGQTFISLLGTGLTNSGGVLTIDTTAQNSAINSYINSSTTIPKTYAPNAFTALNTFSNSSTTLASFSYASATVANIGTLNLSLLSSGALAVNGTGQVYSFSTSTWTFASSTLLGDSNTFSGANKFTGSFSLPSLAQGFAYLGTNGTVNTIASSTVKLSWFTNDAGFTSYAFPFTVNVGYNSTSTAIGFGGGLFSTASSTFSSALRLASLSQGLTYVGSTGLVSTIATTSAACSGSVSCSGFTVIGSSPVTITGTDSTASTTLFSDTNTFTGRQIFTNSSTTLGSFNYASATTAYIGTLNLGGPLTLSGAAVNSLLSTNASGQIVATSTPTFGSFNATSTNATSTIAGGLAVKGTGFVYDFSSNRVGIGTAAPTQALDITGNINVTGGIFDTGSKVFEYAGSNSTIYAPGGAIIFQPNGNEAARFASTGFLGLGSTTPGYRLSVAGSGYFDGGTVTANTLIATSSIALPNSSQGFAYLGTGGLVQTIASSSVKLSWFNNDAGFLTSLSGAASSTLLSDTNFFSGVNRFAFSSTTYASFTAASTTNLTLGFLNISTSTAGTLKTNASGAVYIDTSSGTAASSTLLADANTFSGVNSFTNALSADVSLSSGNALAVTVGGNPTFAVGKDGRLTYGNAFIVYSTSAAVNFGNNVGSADATTPGYFLINPSSANTGNLFNVQKAGASKFVINTNGNVGIGTTTPFYGLVSASSTAPQLSLSAGAGLAQWAFRNAGGNLYLSTTTVAGTSTTSNSALSIDGTTGVVSLAKALPETSGGTNQTSYATGDILYASGANTLSKLPIGGNGLVLKVVGGLPSWQTDLTSGGGGGATAWSTTTDSLAIYPTDTTDVLLLGTNSTSTLGNIFEVLGNSLFRGNLAVTGSATFAYSSTTYASFATASTTNLNIGLGQGFAYVGSNGSVNSIASSSVKLSWFNNDAGFLTSLSGAASSTLLADANTFSGANKFTSLLNYGGTAVNSLLSTDASGNIRATSTPTFGSFNATSTNATSTVAGGFAFGSNSVIQQNSGNLGIGITNPSQALQVNGNAIVGQSITGGFYTPAPLALVNSAAGTLKTQLNLVNTGGGGGAGSAIDFYTYTTAGNGLPESRIGSTDDGNYSASLDFYTKDPGNTGNNSLVNRLHIATGGNIGVGSTSPGYNLSVVGSGYFDGGAVTAKSFVATSSIALPNSSQGFAYLGTGGLVQTIASSSVKLSWFNNDAGFTAYAFPFTVNTGYNSTSTVLGLNGFFSTASSTISGAFNLPAISSGALAVNGSGLVYSFSTSTWTFASSTLLSDSNSFTGVNRFALSSTTYGSFTTASTTNLNIGGSSFISLLGTGLTNSGGALTIDTTAQNNAINSYIAASTTIPKTYTANTFTALNTFSNSSTSLASFSYASSTVANIGTLNLGLSTGGLAVNGAGQVYSFSTSTWTFASSTLLSDANTFSGADRFTGSFSLPSLSQGFAYLGSNGLVQSVSTSTIANYILPFTSYGAATSTVLGLNGFFSTASSTISGPFRLSALSNGGLAVFNGLVSSGATTTAGTGLTYSANAFNVNATQNITNLSNLSSNGVVYTAGSNGTLNTTSTSTLAVGSSLTVSSGALGYQLGGSNATIALNLANPNTWTALQTFTNSSTTLGSFAYASATAAYIGTLNLGSLSQGYSYVGSNGALNTVSTSTLAGQVFPFTSSTGYNSTSTAIGFGGGLFSTASSTFSSALRLSSLSQGFAYLGSSGTVNSIASSSINLSWFTNDAGFLTNYDAFTHPGAGYSATTSSFAVGTSTSFIASLTIASSTANQLSLSAGTGLAQFTFRNAGGNLYLSTTTVAGTATTSISALEIAGSGFGTTTVRGLNIVGQATTTSNVGISLSGGCFAINGNCITLSSLASFAPNSIITTNGAGNLIATGTQLTVGNLLSTTTAASYFLGSLGVGTSTTNATLDVAGTGAGKVFEASGSSGAPFLSVSNTGFGTTTLSGLNVAGSATSTANVGFNLTNGCFAVNGACIVSAAGAGSVNGGFTGQFAYYASDGSTVSGTSALTVDGSGNIGVNNASPAGRLHVLGESTDGAVLVVDQGASSNPWAIQFSRSGFSDATVQLVGNFALGWQASLDPYTDDNSNFTLGTASKRWNSLFVGTGSSQFDGALTLNGAVTANSAFSLPNLSQGFAYLGSSGTVNTIASSSVKLSWFNNDAGFLTSLSGAASSTLLADANTFSNTNNFTGKLGLASSSPWGQLSVNPTSANGAAPSFVIGSSTATNFVVTNAGFVGIGTTSPQTILALPASTVATGGISFGDDAHLFRSGSGILATEGTFASNVLYASAFGFIPTLYGSNAAGGNLSLESTADANKGRIFLGANGGYIGVGTSTVSGIAGTTIASSTASQLALSAGAGLAQWAFRNAGGNLYISTTTVAGTATSTQSALSINGTTGALSLGTTTAGVLKTTSTGLVYADNSLQSAASSTLLSDTNTFTGRQIFTNSSTTLGSFAYASATAANIGTLTLGSLTSGFAGIGANGQTYSFATSTIKTSQLTNDANFTQFPFTVNTGYNSTSTAIGFGGGLFSTASSTFSSALRLPSLTQGVAYVGSTGLVNTTSTSTLAVGSSLSSSGTLGFQLGGSNTTLSLNLANANIWTALQTFNYSSSTVYSSFVSASTTNLNIGLSQGFAYLGTGGRVNSIASSSINLSWFNNDAGFLTSLSGAASSTLLSDTNFFTGVNRFALSSTTYGSFATASTTNLILNGQSFNSLLGTGLSNVSGALTIDTTAQNNAINSYIAASTTIPKTYTSNTFTALQTFGNSSTTLASFGYASSTVANIGTLNLGLSTGGLAVNGAGQVYSFSTSTWTFASSTLLSDANTFSGADRFTGSFSLPSLSQGFAYLGTGGLVNTIASSSVNLSWFNNDAGFLTSLSGAASSTLLSDTNTFTGRQTFTNSSTTLASFAYASATAANIGTLNLGSLTSGFAGIGANGQTYSFATSTIKTSQLTNDAGFVTAAGAFPFTSVAGYNSTSTAIGFTGGLFSTASSTFSSALRLSSLSQGFAYTGSTGLVSTISTSTLASQIFAANTFAANSIITTNASGNLIATGTQLTVGNLLSTTTANSYFLGTVGIGTTTPVGAGSLDITSNLSPQLFLGSGVAGQAMTAFRNDGTVFSIGTTTIAGTATSSINALEIALGGFGTTTVRGLNIVGQATTTSNVGFNITTGCYAIGGNCLNLSGTFPFTSQTYGNSTSSVIGFTGGLFSTASSTFSSALRLSSLSQGFAYLGSGGTVNSIASSSVNLSWFNNDAGFLTSLSGAASSTLLSDTNFFSGVNRFALSSTTYGSFTTASTTNFRTGFLTLSTTTAGILKTTSTGAVYVDTSSGTAASSTLLADFNTFSNTNNFTGKLGLASSTPWGQLSINPNALGSGVPEFVIGSSSATHLVVTGNGTLALGTSTPSFSSFSIPPKILAAGSDPTAIGNAIVNSDTTGVSALTFGNDIALTGAYFAFNGFSGSGTSGLYGGAASFNMINAFAAPITFGTSNLVRATISAGGNFGIGTSSPYAMLSVAGEIVGANLTATSTTATSTIAGGLTVGNGAINYDYSSGVTSIANLQIGGTSFDSDAGIVSWMDMPVTSASPAGTEESYTANINGNPVLSIFGRADGSGGLSQYGLGVGTSTTSWLATFASAAQPQLSLSAGAGIAQWAFRNAGGNFYLSTTTVAGTSTSTLAALSINGTTGALSLGTTTAGTLKITSAGLVYADPSSGTAASSTLLSDVNFFSGVNRFALSSTTYGSFITASTTNFRTGFLTLSTSTAGTLKTTSTGAVYVDTSSGTAASSTLLADFNTFSNTNNFTGKLGIGTSTPWGQLSINPTSANGSAPAFVIGSSTETDFIIGNDGGVAIGTSSTFGAGSLNIYSKNNSAQIGLQGVGDGFSYSGIALLSSPNNFWLLSHGQSLNHMFSLTYTADSVTYYDPFIIEPLAPDNSLYINSAGHIGIGTSTPNAFLAVSGASAVPSDPTVFNLDAAASEPSIMTFTSGGALGATVGLSSGANNFFTGTQAGDFALLSASGHNVFLGVNNNAGNNVPTVMVGNGFAAIGTTSAYYGYGLTVASSTKPQLSLSAGAGLAQWTFRNAGGNFYLSTTTVAGTATTSTAALTILNGGNVGIGTTNPGYSLQVAGSADILQTEAELVVSHAAGASLAYGTNNKLFFGNASYMTMSGTANYIENTNDDGVFSIRATGLRGQLALKATGSTNPSITFTTGSFERARFDLNGNFGIGTTSPGSILSIGDTSGINFTTATSTFNSTGGINLANGCFAIAGSCIGSGSFSNTIANGGTGSTSFAPNSIIVSNAAGTALIATGSQLTVGSLVSTTTNPSYFLGRLGIGTYDPDTDFLLDLYGSEATPYASTGGTSVPAGGISASITNDSDTDNAGSYLLLASSNSGTTYSRAYIGGISTPSSESAQIVFGQRTAGGYAERMRIDSTGNIGIGSSTPWGLFSVNPNALGSNVPEFIIGSSSMSHFVVNGAGQVGIGQFDGTVDVSLAIAGSDATTYAPTGAGKVAGGPFSIEMTNTSQTNTAGSYISLGSFNTAGTKVRSYIGSISVANSGTPSLVFGQSTSADASTHNEVMRIDSTGNVGVATTTPRFQFTIASSTASQLALSAGAGLAQWTFRNAGGNFYLATTTVAGTATSTLAALTINGTTGALSLGTTTAGCLQTTSAGLVFAATCASGASDAFTHSTIFAPTSATTSKIGIGTTTPYYSLTVASSTGAQLALSSGTAGLASWAFRNAGGNLYISTTTTAGTSTSTLAALTVQTSTGNVGIASTTPWAQLSISPTGTSNSFAIGSSSKTNFLVTGSGAVGLGTTSPWGLLSINPTAFGSGVPEFVIGSSSMTHFIVTGSGAVGIGTTSPNATFSVAGTANISGHMALGNVAAVDGNGVPTIAGTPTTVLNLQEATTDPAGIIGIHNHILFDSSSEDSGNSDVIGTLNEVETKSGNPNDILDFIGGSFLVTHNGSGVVGPVGVIARLINNSDGTMYHPAALDGWVTNQGAGTLLSPKGVYTSTPLNNNNGSIDSGYGVYIDAGVNGGTYNSAIGLFIEDQTWVEASSSFNIYSEGLDSLNFFEGKVGIGTTTPSSIAKLTLATTTTPQLSLSAGEGFAQWAFRNAGGNFYLATTTVAGTATSTLAALSINGATGAVSLGTTTAGTLKVNSAGLIYADPSGGGGGYATVQDEGSNLTQRTTLNFTGTGVACSDNSGSSRTDCVINAGGAATVSIGSTVTSGTSGSVLYVDGSGNLAQDNSNFFWDASGKRLGLGTTTPFAKLSVNSTAGQAALVVGSSTATSLIVDAYGNVGIGTSTVPTGGLGTSKLTISDSDASAITANLVNTSSTGISAYGLGNDATPSLAAIFTSGSSGAGISGLFGGANSLNVMNFANAPLAFGTNGTVQATLTGAGNLGIGTTNPGDSRLFVYNNIAAPSAVTPNIYSLVEGKGDNATLKGVMGGYFQAKDRTDVDGTNKGILYGVTIDIAPSVARNNVPYDDATGLLVSNAGTAKATDAIYVGNNPSIVGSQWVSGVLVETNADYAYRAVGTFSTALMNLDDQFFVAPDGSTGIGTTSPARKFSLVGDMFLNTSNIWLGTTTSATGSTSTIFALATTSILINPDAAMAFSIGTSSNSYGNGTGPILNIATSKSGANSTTTLGIFVATTTGLYAGKGTPMTKGNHIFIGDGISTTTINIARGNLCIDSDGYCNVATGTANTQGGQIYARKYVTSAADLAEMYTSTDNLSAGELVSASANSVSRATRATESTLIGVVSTDPGFVLGDQGSGYPIALAGRVPVKVNDENGSIAAGDAITISSTPGVGMKAGNRSRVVAIALEDLVGSSGMISAFITKYTYTDETLFNINENGNIGIGTSSPVFGLTAYSATAPQFALSAGAGLAQWTFRNAGGNFYLGTSTINGLSTTSTSALTVAGSGFGTTTVTGLNINAQATTTSNVGMNITGGCYAVNGTCVGGGSGDTGTSKFIVKSSDETVNSGTTLQTDDELSFPIASGETWVFDFTLIVDNYNSATPDWKSAILGASGWSCKVVLSGAEGAGTAFPQATTTDCDNSPTTTVNNAVSAAPGGMNVHMQGWITATSDGTVQLEWAPNTSGKLTVLAGSYVLAQKVGGADLAEVYYTKDASIEAGDVVSLDKDVVAGVKKANKAFGRDTLGIVSTKPGLLLGDGETNTDDLPVRVALAGRVPVKVSDEGGNIAVGDSIAASSEDGYGMKAHPGDTVIATALASVDFASSTHGIVLAFVNKSNDVPALSGLDMMVVGTSTPGLEAVKGMAPVTYSFGNSSSTRFGFVPEDLETLDPHFVSIDESGKITGINYDQLTPVLVSSIQELDVKVDSLDARLANLEALVGTSTSSGGAGASLDGILAAFEDLGAKFMQGIAYIRNLVVDSLTVGSHDKPSGITLFDDVTGDPYCLKMHDGAMVSAAGACENMATSTPEGDGGSGDGSGEEAPAGDTTSPVITVNGENPATIFYGATYSDMGASVRDIDENGQVNDNLGLHFTVDGVDMPQVSIDASISTSSPQTATTTHVIVYSAVDGAGNWGYATRTVDVIPQQ